MQRHLVVTLFSYQLMVLNLSFHASITATFLHLYTVSAHKPSLVLTLYFLQLRCRKNRLVVEWLLLREWFKTSVPFLLSFATTVFREDTGTPSAPHRW